MINELISALIVSLGFIGAIMAMKWKNKNAKPRIQDEELDKFKKSHNEK
tara:strand:- start:324 stop:470 length:147 start_codon:yes stop_codon:yes gene_type:complete